jgi:CheY-like chemotaxis protein
MLTAHAMAGDRERYIVAGADDYLAKPISVSLLNTKLARIARGPDRMRVPVQSQAADLQQES